MGKGQCCFECAVTSHGKSRNVVVLSCRRNPSEKTGHHFRKLLGDIGEIAVAGGKIGIEAPVAVGHNYSDPGLCRIQFDLGIPLPYGLIVGKTVQKVQGLITFPVLGNKGVNRNLPVQCFREKMQCAECHSLPLSISFA